MKPVLRDGVYLRLRDRIIAGELRQGTPLAEIRMAEEFGVSRLPVREAIHRLSEEGYAEYLPHKGARVATATPALVREVLQIREGLEGIAAREAAIRIRADRLADLRERFDALRAELDSGILTDAGDLIHDEMLAASGNHRLLRLMSVYHGQVLWLQRMAAEVPGQLVRAFREHESILASLEARDPDWAESAARAHIRNTLRELLVTLEMEAA